MRGLRAQLTVLYAGAFVLCGGAVLSVALLRSGSTSPVGGAGAPGGIGGPAGVGGPGGGPGPGPSEAEVAARHDLIVTSLVGFAVMAVVAVVLGWLIAGRFLRPLRTITATAQDISASNLHRRLGVTGRDDEFHQLAGVLDDLFARLEASFDAQRRFVANASHELRTPLTAERTLLQVALADPDASAATLRTACQEVLALGESQARLIDALLTLASSESGVQESSVLELDSVVSSVLSAFPEVDRELGSAVLRGDVDLVESLVQNLVGNAVRHNVAGGWVRVTTGAVDGRAVLTVSNSGPVIPPSEVARLLEPFQQLDGPRLRSGGGHGLGLPIVRAIADAHRAELGVAPRPTGGLTVTVTFPDPARA
ncbi:sensor histidine kinase [Cryptosporangium phraense]|uniref:histidine kinase n=1 Tax=Cryptosporangium phraense TaxID=2593070 RepID=A0A545ALL1_9ACTN|nr:HAMP domain-containing sensor histidine kinase [Cryptosporangium phraense]TQS42150.1 HAMP domain-containing histidine kinase [Cryptosporangium phraense]